MLLELTKSFSFFVSMFALYPVVAGAFFVPGSHWQDRLIIAAARMGLAGCLALVSGILFSKPWANHDGPGQDGAGRRLLAALPVRIYLWTILGVAILFLLSWYLEEFYVPYLWKSLPY
ncbi:MAG: hypothetical protein WAL75_08350 [Terracidiphilus sp.]